MITFVNVGIELNSGIVYFQEVCFIEAIYSSVTQLCFYVKMQDFIIFVKFMGVL